MFTTFPAFTQRKFARYLFVASAELFPRPRLSSKTCRERRYMFARARRVAGGHRAALFRPGELPAGGVPTGPRAVRTPQKVAPFLLSRITLRTLEIMSVQQCLTRFVGFPAGYTSRRSGRWSVSRLTRGGQRAPSTNAAAGGGRWCGVRPTLVVCLMRRNGRGLACLSLLRQSLS